MPSVAPSVATALKSILVATDFSKVSEKPIRHAFSIARHFGAKFYLTQVVSSLGYMFAGPQGRRSGFGSRLARYGALGRESG